MCDEYTAQRRRRTRERPPAALHPHPRGRRLPGPPPRTARLPPHHPPGACGHHAGRRRPGARARPHHRRPHRRTGRDGGEARPGGPWRFVNNLSRLVVDPERFPDEREEMLAVGMGAVYTRTTHREPLRPPEDDPTPLLEAYFHPYATAMTEAVEARVAAAGRAVIIDVHSYPTEPSPTSSTAPAPARPSAWAPTRSTPRRNSSRRRGRRSATVSATTASGTTHRSPVRTFLSGTTERTAGSPR